MQRDSGEPTTDSSFRTESATQYGVRTPHSNAVLTITNDRATAERALDWIPNGQIVTRVVSTSSWQPAAETTTDADAGRSRARLHDELASRAAIDQAVGIIRGRSGASAEEALSRLVHVSRADASTWPTRLAD